MARSAENPVAVGVFLSAKDLPPKYTEPAVEFGKLLVQQGYRFVYGGSEVGLMKVVADIVEETGGSIVAVSTTIFQSVCRTGVSEVFLTGSISERKNVMLRESDAVVALSGGTGTLDEVTEIIELRKNNAHDKPVVFINTGGFWNGLKIQLETMEQEGFLFKPLHELLYFAESPQDAISYLNKHLGSEDKASPEEVKDVVLVIPPEKAG